MNDFDPKDYLPQPTTWFDLNVEYRGWGKAQFTAPSGYLEGESVVSYDEYGKYAIQMEVKSLTFEGNGTPIELATFNMDAFLRGAGYEEIIQTNGLRFLSGCTNNPCIQFEVKTEDGTFSAEDPKIRYQHAPFELLTNFHPLKAKFDHSRKESHFFVLPLLNFISDLPSPSRHSEILYHPLRLAKTPTVPADLDGINKRIAEYNARSKCLIEFEIFDKPAFIEPVQNWQERHTQLADRERDRLVTAILVGEIRNIEEENPSSERLEELSKNILALLTLATGAKVGSPWIEIRDAEGGLVKRIHRQLAYADYEHGHASLAIGINNGGIGYLLSQAQTSEYFGHLYLRAVLDHLNLAGQERGINVEHRLAYLFRGLDGLRKILLANEPTNLHSLLNEAEIDAIEQGVQELHNSISALADSSTSDEKQEAIRRIAEHPRKWKEIRLGYGKSVMNMLEQPGIALNDGRVLTPYYRARGEKWTDILSRYRGKVIHEGWLDWQSADLNTPEIVAMIYHLHDLMIRIVLKMLNYEEDYLPSIIKLRGSSRSVNWVQPETSATDLGYPP